MFLIDIFSRNSQRTAQHMLIEGHRCVLGLLTLVLFNTLAEKVTSGESQRLSSDFLGWSLSIPEQDFLKEK